MGRAQRITAIALFLALFLTLQWNNIAAAQGFGISAILNPEGSRLFPQSIIYPRHAGKPDPRWKDFEWHYADRSTPSATGETRYRLFFYDVDSSADSPAALHDRFWPAEFAIPKIDSQISALSSEFNYNPTKSFSYLLFSSYREFQQANIFSISEGVQGITSTIEPTMAIPYWGEYETFRHISAHEMVHQFQVQKMNDLSGQTAENSQFLIPLWFIEGMAEYYSLGGIDPETRQHVRDLSWYPEKDRDYTVGKFFEAGVMDFAHVYKLGQVKIGFIEKSFGKGSAQRILETASKKLGREHETFNSVVTSEVSKTSEEIETLWAEHIQKDYLHHFEKAQSLDLYQHLGEAGETLDHYQISPDSSLLAIREVDPLTGVTSVALLENWKHPGNSKKHTLVKSQQGDVLSLYFLQAPIIALTNQSIAYVAATAEGPVLELKSFQRRPGQELKIGKGGRIHLSGSDILQAHSPAFSPDETKIAFVGMNSRGWQNIYIAEVSALDSNPIVRQITDESYAWKSITWTSQGIVAASDRTSNARYNLFKIDPDTRKVDRLTHAHLDQLGPDGDLNPAGSGLVFQGWKNGNPDHASSQIHLLRDGKEIQLTQVNTGLFQPLKRGDDLYALGFKSGRYRLYQIPKTAQLSLSVHSDHNDLIGAPAWKPTVTRLKPEEVQSYEAFKTSGKRLEDIAGFIGSGNIIGLSATVSDLMRNYVMSGEFLVLGDFSQTHAAAFLTSHRGRSTWTAGAYHTVQTRLDSIFDHDETRLYSNREFGVLGLIQYPLGPFSYFDTELRVAGVKRSAFSDPLLEAEWEKLNPGMELMMAPMFRIGRDEILYETFSGPLSGFGILFEADTSVYPGRGDLNERIRLDIAQYWQLHGSSVLTFQGIAGASWGGQYRNPFLVSSDDFFRGYGFSDDRLRGNYLLGAKTELRFPVGSLFSFPPLRGLIAADYGTIWRHFQEPGRGAASSYTWGFNINLPPLGINFMFSYPIHLAAGTRESPVFHFTLRYLYL